MCTGSGEAQADTGFTRGADANAAQRRNKRLLIAFGALVFGSLIPSQGEGISWDEVLELSIILLGSGYILSNRLDVLRSRIAVLGLFAVVGNLGMLTHEPAYAVFGRCVQVSLFVVGLLVSEALPDKIRSPALLCVGIGAVIGTALAAYLDLHGWTAAGGMQSSAEWQADTGARGTLSSRCTYTILICPTLIAYARRWRRGHLVMAAMTLPYSLVVAAGIGQGRTQTIEILLGTVIALNLNAAVPIIILCITGVTLFAALGWNLQVPLLFEGFARRVSDVGSGPIDRLEHAQSAMKLLREAGPQELLLGIPARKIEVLIEGAGIHSGYLEPAVIGGLVAAVPFWIMFGYLMTKLLKRGANQQDAAGVAGISVIAQVLVFLATAPIFWEWHGAWFFGLICGFACSPHLANEHTKRQVYTGR